MSGELLFEAVGGVDSEYIEQVARRLGYYIASEPSRRHRGRGLRSAFAAVLVAAALLVLGALTAMAVSEPVRDAVLGFFGVEYHEDVPDALPEPAIEPDVESSGIIGGEISGSYLYVPGTSYVSGGLVLSGADEIMFNSGSRWNAYVLHDGELEKLNQWHIEGEYELLGQNVRIAFDCAGDNGRFAIACDGTEGRVVYRPFSGPPERSLMSAYIQDVGYYPFIFNMVTGELTDVLAGTQAAALRGMENAALCGGGRYMLLAAERGKLYCIDLYNGVFYDLEQISGEKVSACSYVGGHVACWNGERLWTIDLASSERSELLDSTDGLVIEGFSAEYNGSGMFAGMRFALDMCGGTVEAIDLTTGRRTRIEGYELPQGMQIRGSEAIEDAPALEFRSSPDGQRVLVSLSVGSYRELTVIDFAASRWYTLNRENDNGMTESALGWFDNTTVYVYVNNPGAEEYGNYYYLYSFPEQTAPVGNTARRG